MKKLIAISLIFMFSCGNKKEQKKALLPKDQIVDIMIQLTLMEEKLDMMNTPSDSAKKMFDYYKNKLFLEKQIKKEDFDNSYSYYLINDLKGFIEIQSTMIDSLTVYKNTLKKF